MARAKGRRSKLLTITIGCFSVIMLIIGISGIMVIWAGLSYRGLGDPTSEAAAMTIAVGDETVSPGATPPPGTDLATLSPGEFPAARRQASPVRLDITLSEGQFEILPGPPGSDITVDGSYATNYYKLVEKRTESDNGQQVSLHLKPTAGWFTRIIAGLTNINDEHPNDLTVYIPPDVPIDLILSLDSGESRVELGGLTLTNLDVELSKGDFRLSFDEPLAATLPRMALSMQMGDGRISGLGNARAEDISVDTGMGDFRLSLAGDWPANSESRMEVNHSMGDLTLTIPSEIHIADDSSNTVMMGGTQGRMTDSEKYAVAADAATLHLNVHTSMGSANVRRSPSSSVDGG
jgi:hypothetical protein